MDQRANRSAQFERLAAGTGCSYEDTPFQSGLVWHSLREEGEATKVQSVLPKGLHIGFGVADMCTRSHQFGGFETHGPVLTALYVPEDGAQFETEVQAGTICSFGLHVADPEAIAADACLQKITSLLNGELMAKIDGRATRQLNQLRTPIDPWFQGDARELMLQARALELTAVVAQTLDVSTTGGNVSPRDLKRASNVRDLIDANLCNPIRLDWLADQCAIDTRSMTRLFRRVYSISIGDYILRRRMLFAERLISQGASVKSAAARIGYNPNAFSTAYRRFFGYSPTR
ncbi:MAG: AraC family transcriptional regulator [Pseudomonadota bacterium]